MAGLSARLCGVGFAILSGVAQADRTGWVQAPLAIAILAAPAACFALFALSLPRSVRHARRRRLRLAAGLLPLVALGIYAVYETGISPETNIRVDLLAIYPALLLAFVVWPALLVTALLRR